MCDAYHLTQQAAPVSSQAVMLAAMTLFYAVELVRRTWGGAPAAPALAVPA